MKTIITTIEELKNKPKSELQAIFRKAASIASSSASPKADRDAARKTLDNLHRVPRP